MTTHSAPSNSSMLKISPSSSAESSTMIRTSVCGLKYMPGRLMISSRVWVLVAMPPLIYPIAPTAGVYPAGRPSARVQLVQLAIDLGLHVERGFAPCQPPLVAGRDQLADLLPQGRVLAGAFVRPPLRVDRHEAADLGLDVDPGAAALHLPLVAGLN